MVTGDGLVNPILNSPYEAPARHFVLGPEGPTGEIKDGRRPSESFIAVPTKRRSAPEAVEELTLDFDLTGERRQVNDSSTTSAPKSTGGAPSTIRASPQSAAI